MKHHNLLKQLLPKGSWWEISRGSAFDKLLSGLSQELARVEEAIAALIPFQIDRSSGSLSRSYVEGQLHSLGYKDFKINDPTEIAKGLQPILDPNLIGVIGVNLPMKELSLLCVGFRVGACVREWRDLKFEHHLNSFLPAHIQARFIYGRK